MVYSPAQPSSSPSPSVPGGTGVPPSLLQSSGDMSEVFPGTLGLGASLLRFGEGLGEGLGVAEGEAECEAGEAVGLALALAVASAKRSYSAWVSSCFQLPFSKTNCVVRSELEPSAEITVR
jgi:hypothetical protein